MTLDREDEITQTASAFVEAVQNLAEVIAAALESFVEAMVEAVQKVHTWMWDCYRAAGMPYGNSHDGMMPWFEERGRMYRAWREAEDERAWQVGMATLRQRLEARQLSG